MVRLIVVVLLCAPVSVWAFGAAFPSPERSSDYISIDSTTDGVFYGELTGFPHTYQLVVRDDAAPVAISLSVLVPDREDVPTDRSVLVVKEETRGVSEVVRLKARETEWKPQINWWEMKRYQHGATYEASLSAGVYLIEVSSPVNSGPYALKIGEGKKYNPLRYISNFNEIRQVNEWYGASAGAVFWSPLVSVPPILFIMVSWWYIRRKTHD